MVGNQKEIRLWSIATYLKVEREGDFRRRVEMHTNMYGVEVTVLDALAAIDRCLERVDREFGERMPHSDRRGKLVDVMESRARTGDYKLKALETELNEAFFGDTTATARSTQPAGNE